MHFSLWSAWNSPAETEGLQKKKKKSQTSSFPGGSVGKEPTCNA